MTIKKHSSKKKQGASSAIVQTGAMGIFPAPAPPAPNSNVSFFKHPLQFIHDHIMYLNSSKFFAGIIMILLNVGSKFISIQFSKSTEEYLKYTLSKQLLVFAMAWMGTRDIYTSLGLTAIFVVLSEHLFNEESRFCIVPHKHRVLHKLIDENGDGVVSDTELNSAIAVLEKAKKEKQRRIQQDAYEKFRSYDDAVPKPKPIPPTTTTK